MKDDQQRARPAQRGWLRFSFFAMLVIVTAACLGLGVWSWRPARSIRIEIRRDHYVVDGVSVSDANVVAAIQRGDRRRRSWGLKSEFRLVADPEVSHGRIIELMGALKTDVKLSALSVAVRRDARDSGSPQE